MLKFDELELRKIHRQLTQVVQRGTAPAVDGLVVVTHSRETRVGSVRVSHQQFHQLVLDGVGVLVLIHQHVAHARLPALAGLLVVT